VLKALEASLGGPLLIRTSRRVELVDAGKHLEAEAMRTLEHMEHYEYREGYNRGMNINGIGANRK
jgi:DNA-binding transcriptional LysR family regulator